MCDVCCVQRAACGVRNAACGMQHLKGAAHHGYVGVQKQDDE
jgi:hypothetical protein